MYADDKICKENHFIEKFLLYRNHLWSAYPKPIRSLHQCLLLKNIGHRRVCFSERFAPPSMSFSLFFSHLLLSSNSPPQTTKRSRAWLWPVGACFHNVEDEWNLGPKLKQVKLKQLLRLRSFFYRSNTATQANQANLTKTLQNPRKTTLK